MINVVTMETIIENYKFETRDTTLGDEELAMAEISKDIMNPISYSLVLANKICYMAVTRMHIDDNEVDKKIAWSNIPRRVFRILQDKLNESNTIDEKLKKK